MNLRTLRSTGAAGLGAAALSLAVAAGAAVPPAGADTASSSARTATSLASSAAAEAPSPRIPRSFPLARGVRGDTDHRVVGPRARIEGLGLVADCGRRLMWPPAGWSRRLALEVRGPEHALDRELVTFRDARGAVRAMTTLRRTLRECPARTRDVLGRRTVVRAHDTRSGYADIGWSVQHPAGSSAIGGRGVQVVRVGSALLATSAAGEIGTRPAGGRGVVERLDRVNRRLTPAMCRWTVRGC